MVQRDVLTFGGRRDAASLHLAIRQTDCGEEKNLPNDSPQKLEHQLRHLGRVGLQQKVPAIQEVDLGVRQIRSKRSGTGRDEDRTTRVIESKV